MHQDDKWADALAEQIINQENKSRDEILPETSDGILSHEEIDALLSGCHDDSKEGNMKIFPAILVLKYLSGGYEIVNVYLKDHFKALIFKDHLNSRINNFKIDTKYSTEYLYSAEMTQNESEVLIEEMYKLIPEDWPFKNDPTKLPNAFLSAEVLFYEPEHIKTE